MVGLDILEIHDGYVLFRFRGIDGEAKIVDGRIVSAELLESGVQLDSERVIRDEIQQVMDSYKTTESLELDNYRQHLAFGDNLGYWVKSGRKSKGWSQRKLAEECGLSVVQISKLENGHALTTLATLQKLANMFGKSFVIAAQD